MFGSVTYTYVRRNQENFRKNISTDKGAESFEVMANNCPLKLYSREEKPITQQD